MRTDTNGSHKHLSQHVSDDGTVVVVAVGEFANIIAESVNVLQVT